MNIVVKHLTPVTNGYVVCDGCGVWRPRAATSTSPEGFVQCLDAAWCRSQGDQHWDQEAAEADDAALTAARHTR